MSDLLRVQCHGIEFENPFLVGSGPPSTNFKVIARSFEEGWGGSVLKTMCLDHSKVRNVAPRYGKHVDKNGECIGFTNIELISDLSLEDWCTWITDLKRKFPTKIVVASIMESPEKALWQELAHKVTKAGSDIIEINFSCPHGMPERKMGAAMGQCPDIVKEVTSWVREAVDIPIWAKMTPNITDIRIPAEAALEGGASGLTAINTILSLAGIDLKTLKPIPTVQNLAAFGGYSYTAVKPIGLRMVGELAMAFPQIPVSGVGGIVDGASAAEYICMGSTTLQVCTAIMLDGFEIIHRLNQELELTLKNLNLKNLSELKGQSLKYFGTMKEMADRLDESRKKAAAKTDRFGADNIVSISKELSL